MTLLLDRARLPSRRDIASGPLAPLADSLATDLRAVMTRELFIPSEKAALSRTGGRCTRDGLLLTFDPWSPRVHRCPRCGERYEGEPHYRWWVMSYQLWLAERAVHGALLHALRRDPAAADLAEMIIDGYVERYLAYPNRDNVLGPTRLFFSTYLESIWLLQICIALDLLEATGRAGSLGARVRERVIEPSAALIGSYDEGGSNRQVWNNAALIGAHALLGREKVDAFVRGRSGLVSHLEDGLLPDGTWYEGENYHLFAHRGLWYAVQIAERLGVTLPAPLVERFDAGFAASFASVLPDLTLPSRRDSQYAISTRQWRFAELCELGLARTDNPTLASMLARLYAPDIPRGDTGRACSTAEVERNLPPSALERADLGWRSQLLARREHGTLRAEPLRSALLEGQGLAVIRRDGGRLYAALDYGHSGGGHGHPDRLNLQLAHDAVRWLDDMGTGSYVDPSLHWYRSTLAHNAPLVGGRSQDRVSGDLRAYDERSDAGWVDASIHGIVPGVRAHRSVIAMPGYLVDVVRWEADGEVQVDLPIHLAGEIRGPTNWRAATLDGAEGLEDGFRFLSDTAVADADPAMVMRVDAERETHTLHGWFAASGNHRWWRATAPGPPGKPSARFYLVRGHGSSGVVRSLVDWSDSVRGVQFRDEVIEVACVDGAIHSHERHSEGWRVNVIAPGTTRRIDLGGARPRPEPRRESPLRPRSVRRAHVVPTAEHAGVARGDRQLSFALGESHYRRSEPSWREVGMPTAVVCLFAHGPRLHVEVEVRKPGPPVFAPRTDWNELDNERPDTNSDGIQLYVAGAGGESASAAWLLVPEPGGATVRVTPIAAGDPPIPIRAAWSATDSGYAVSVELSLPASLVRDGFALDLIVNEISPERERRRGQLVLSGAAGEWLYLRGDRQERERFLDFVLDGHAR